MAQWSRMGGGAAITRREAEVLELVRAHATNAEIAGRLYVSERTVESHVSSLLRKFAVADRRALIRAVAALEPAAGAADHLPPELELIADPPSFVGRDEEQAQLRAAWDRAADGQALAVVVAGEAGIGKSRLVAELSHDVHRRGARVLLGASFEDDHDAYRPFVDVAVAIASKLDDEEARACAGAGARALAVLSPELALRLDPFGDFAGEAADQVSVVDALCRWVLAEAERRPLLLVLEDLHWMGQTGRAVLRSLVRRTKRVPMLVVCTTRDTAPDLDTDLAALLGQLERLPTVRTISVGGLGPEAVARVAGVDDQQAERIHADTGGNPLLVKHTASTVGRPESLAALLARREALLDPSARDVLDLASTLGAEFDAEILVRDSQDGLLPVLESLESAEQAGWILPLPGIHGRFTFVHPLFRSHRYESLPLRRRLELHRRASIALAARGHERLSERARHACLAVPVGDARSAIELACQAGEAAERSCAFHEAAGHYRRAQDVVGALEPFDARTSLDLRIRLAAVLHHAGDPEGLTMLLEAAESARTTGDHASLVRAALAIPHFGAIMNPTGDDLRFIAITRDALDALEPDMKAERVLLTADLACQLVYTGRIPESLRVFEDALGAARDLGDVALLGRVLQAGRHVMNFVGRLDEYEQMAHELGDLGQQLGDIPFLVAAKWGQAIALRQRGDVDAWLRAVRRFRGELADHPLAFFRLALQSQETDEALLQGRLAEADRRIVDMAPIEVSVGYRGVWTALHLAFLRRLQGRDDELRPFFERLVRGRPGQIATRRAVLGAICAHEGDHETAKQILDELRELDVPEMMSWDMTFSELAELADIEGDVGAGRRVIDAVTPFAGLLGCYGPTVGRPFDQVLAQAALVVDPVAAAEHAARAVARSRERGTPVFLARELTFLAEARRRVGRPPGEVEPLVLEAQSLADATGAGVVHADLARYGLACR